MLNDRERLMYYSRKDVQEELALHAQDKEIGVRFNDKFGSRPDVLQTTGDILEYARRGATSFHASEELWRNPMQLKSDMSRQEQDALRKGWDLVIDVDCPVWEYSKLITFFIVQALRENGVTTISCKFSGNKGFHIGVPFEAFPKVAGGKDTRLLFPDGVRIIASYLVEEIDKNGRFSEYVLKKGLLPLIENMGLKQDELLKNICVRCKTQKKDSTQKSEYLCGYCGRSEMGEGDSMKLCMRCGRIMERKSAAKATSCHVCKGTEFRRILDVEKVLNVDAVLISSRHLYRMPYSLHEKSGLISLPIAPDSILDFTKEMAKPSASVDTSVRFLERGKAQKNDASMLFDRAFQWHLSREQTENAKKAPGEFTHEVLTEALPREVFPPCITLILNGIVDGRKRAVFVLLNFLRSAGYDYATIETMLYEWNKKNPEPLREVTLKGQLAYHKQQHSTALPPNCNNSGYMLGMGVCKPDSFCPKIRNPFQYAKRKAQILSENAKGAKKTPAKKKQAATPSNHQSSSSSSPS